MSKCDGVLELGSAVPKLEKGKKRRGVCRTSSEDLFAFLHRGRARQEETVVKWGIRCCQRNIWGKIALIIVGSTVAVAAPVSFLFPLLSQTENAEAPVNHHSTVPPVKLCDTEECDFVSGLYRDALPHPCTDFYEHVCARWKKREDSFNSSVINQQNTKITGSVITFLRSMLVPPRGQTASQKAAGLFQSCMALGNRNGTSNQDSKADILKFLAEHGATLDPQSSPSGWYLALDFSLIYGLPTVSQVRFEGLSNDSKHSQVVLEMRPRLTYKHIRNETVIVDHLWWLGVEAKLIPAVLSMIKTIERYLVLVSDAISAYDESAAQKHVSMYPLHNLEEIVTSKAGENWNNYMKNISGRLLPGEHDLAFESNRIKTFLQKVFRTVDANRLAVWVAFDVSLQLRLMTHVISATPLEEKREYYRLRLSRSSLRQKQCLMYTTMVMHSATYSSYYRSVVTKEVAAKAVNTVSSIEGILRLKIMQSSWLGEEIKNEMLQRLANMKKIIGYPFGPQDESLEMFYASFEDAGASFIKNWLRASRSRLNSLASRRAEEHIIMALREDISLASGKYVPNANTMVLGLGLLLPPFFDTVRPIDYASMGHFAAHEMMHAFYDLHTSRTEEKHSTWRKEYTKRVKCIRDAYTLPNAKFLSSSFTKDPEIVADFGALPAVYSAYVHQKNRTNSPLRLLRLPEMTDDQLFFIAFCYMWCSNLPPSLRYPDFKSRCNALLKNMPEFAAAFKCPAGSPMNPGFKCTFW